jgi:hypothetical protein
MGGDSFGAGEIQAGSMVSSSTASAAYSDSPPPEVPSTRRAPGAIVPRTVRFDLAVKEWRSLGPIVTGR